MTNEEPKGIQGRLNNISPIERDAAFICSVLVKEIVEHRSCFQHMLDCAMAIVAVRQDQKGMRAEAAMLNGLDESP